MLNRLSIRNIVLIEALDLDFAKGLGVLTGETGAGKSILLDALGLVIGNRADSGLVRAGEDRATVTASFEFAQLPNGLRAVLDDADVEIEPGEPLILKRQLKADGGSRAFLNDQPVGVALLREIAPTLVEIHGQHDDRGLVNARGHRALLDRFAGGDVAGVEAAWKTWRTAQQALDSARAQVAKAAEDQDLLLAHLAELDALAPLEGEEEELAQARAGMQKGEKLADDLAALQHLWTGSDSALASLRGASRRLDRIAGEHPLLAEAMEALDRAVIEASEAEDRLDRAAEALAFDPDELDRIETRLFDLRAAARKQACQVDDLPEKMREMRSALDAIEGGEEHVAALERTAQKAALAYRELAEALHDLRCSAAKRLDKAVAAELAPLKLDAARFQTSVIRLPEERWNAQGMDGVEFLISTNPGADFAPLAKIASEGQLLAVTHSPQVAARGRRHYMIAKSSEGTVTRTSVALLDEGERKEEIARMLSGAEVTAEARAQADRLLEV